jgi:diketogulonate reductase-like aldo/keto reductase
MPQMLYGTAWKKEQTTDLVIQAVLCGFRGIDTACQPKHYREDLVGVALRELASKHGIEREKIFLQTKFTPVDGQDLTRPIPYDRRAPLREQVLQSFATSLKNLGTDHINSLVLHSPLRGGFRETLEVWRAMETLHAKGVVERLGISNCYDVKLLQRLCESARVRPSIVQNRFYADSGYDAALRRLCAEGGVGNRAGATHSPISYQSFWTLTANPDALRSKPVRAAAQRLKLTPEQVFFFYLITAHGITPLTGTCDAVHMRQDLAVCSDQPTFCSAELTDEEMYAIGKVLSRKVR